MNKLELKQRFIELFGEDSTKNIRYFYAPGRVNIIGEHIDYSGGHVLPCGLNMGTYALILKRDDDNIRFASINSSYVIEVCLNDIKYEIAHNWANYPKGIVHLMQADGKAVGGFDVLFYGNMPHGAGLSSSASLEIVLASALNNVFALGYTMLDLIKLSQKCENDFCGINCGIMDQFAIGMSKKDNAILLNCNTLDYSYIKLDTLAGYKIIIMNTNKKRKLSESKYNIRRKECEQALSFLQKSHNIKYLAQLSPETFLKYQGLIKNKIAKNRAKHVVYENNRVHLASKALVNGDIEQLGELLQRSHMSLSKDYEVSCVELDTIVDEALKIEGCIGARMTGAGFGGCAIALVKNDNVKYFSKKIVDKYTDIIGYAPSIYIQESGEGPNEI